MTTYERRTQDSTDASCAECEIAGGTDLLRKDRLKQMPEGRGDDIDGGYDDDETDQWTPYGDGVDARGELSRLAPEELIENLDA